MSEYHYYRCDNCGEESEAHKGFMGKGLPLGWITLSEKSDLDLSPKKGKKRRTTLYAQVCSFRCAQAYLTAYEVVAS